MNGVIQIIEYSNADQILRRLVGHLLLNSKCDDYRQFSSVTSAILTCSMREDYRKEFWIMLEVNCWYEIY